VESSSATSGACGASAARCRGVHPAVSALATAQGLAPAASTAANATARQTRSGAAPEARLAPRRTLWQWARAAAEPVLAPVCDVPPWLEHPLTSGQRICRWRGEHQHPHVRQAISIQAQLEKQDRRSSAPDLQLGGHQACHGGLPVPAPSRGAGACGQQPAHRRHGFGRELGGVQARPHQGRISTALPLRKQLGKEGLSHCGVTGLAARLPARTAGARPRRPCASVAW